MSDETLTEDQRRLLERWYDGEAGTVARRRAESLLESNDEAEAFVEALEELGEAARAADEAAATTFETPAPESADEIVGTDPLDEQPLEELAPLLERAIDGELTSAEAATVRQLRRAREDVADYLDTLETLGEAAQKGFDASAPADDLDDLADEVLEDLEAEGAFRDEHRGEDVVDVPSDAPPERTESADGESEAEEPPRVAPRQRRWQPMALGAGVAAAIILSLLALLDVEIFSGGDEEVTREKVVIVDRVQYSPGTSVVVRGRRADRTSGSGRRAQNQPTVIWMLRNKDEGSTAGQRPGPAAEPAGTPAGPDAGAKPDASPTLRGEPDPI
ncbi:MAG: hypothetical protein ABEL76_04170 [Bradymonadaceae bacterium]